MREGYQNVRQQTEALCAPLAVEDYVIQSMPDGYETQIGDGGQALSGGQRQRVALARTLFRRPPILVLDEPNANLDSEGEQALANAIHQLKGKSTILIVTHKVNLLGLVDKILIMQMGQVTQYGERDQVLAMLQAPAQAAPAAPAPQ